MKGLIFCTLLAGLVATSLAATTLTTYNQDCNRKGDLANFCQNGGSCNFASGKCDCATGFTGPDCKEPDPGTACTSLNCGDGRCKEDGTDKCFCDEGFESDGTTCISRVVVTTCTSTEMTMQFIPYGDPTFPGKVYIRSQTDVSCIFQDSAAVTSAKELTLAFTGSACGDADTDATDASIRTFTADVQYDSTMTSTLDQALTFQCKIQAAGESQETEVSISSITDLDPVADVDTVKPTATNSETGLKISLVDSSGTELTGEQKIGTEVILRFSLDLSATTGFLNFHINSVKATTKDDPTLELLFVTDGCGQQDARSSLKSFNRLENPGVEVRVDMGFKIFKFVGQPDLFFVVDVTPCSEAACTSIATLPTTCTDVAGALTGLADINVSGTKVYRKKRQTVTDELKHVRLNVSTLVTDGITFVTPSRVQQVSQADCMQSLVFLLPLILLSVMLIVAMMVAVFFCLKVNNQRKYHDGGVPNIAYKS